MRRVRCLVAAALMVMTASACTAQYGDSRSADSSDYGDSHAYRYYAGPGADIVPGQTQQH